MEWKLLARKLPRNRKGICLATMVSKRKEGRFHMHRHGRGRITCDDRTELDDAHRILKQHV